MNTRDTTADGHRPSAYERWTERARAAIDRLQDEGRLPLTDPIKPGIVSRPYNGLTGAWYSGCNLLWLHLMALIEAYAEHRWLTYRQAARLGAQVRKGERGSPILVFRPATRRRDEGDEEEEERRGYFTCATVFNASQIDDLPSAESFVEVEDLSRVETVVDAFARATGADIRITEVMFGGERGAYLPVADCIRMRPRSQFTHGAQYYSTLLHELAHWTGHESRLGRELAARHGNAESYAREELRAEMTAFTLSQTFGLGFEPRRSVQYLAAYEAQLADPEALAKAAGESTAIVRYLCELADPEGALVPRAAAPAAVDTDTGGSRED